MSVAAQIMPRTLDPRHRVAKYSVCSARFQSCSARAFDKYSPISSFQNCYVYSVKLHRGNSVVVLCSFFLFMSWSQLRDCLESQKKMASWEFHIELVLIKTFAIWGHEINESLNHKTVMNIWEPEVKCSRSQADKGRILVGNPYCKLDWM